MASAPGTCVCSICLTIYTDAVSMEHNFCPKCMDRVLNTQEGSDIHCHPEYKEELEASPSIKSAAVGNLNLHLVSALEEPPAIPCSYCIHSSAPAVKTCLHCEAFLCVDHLRVHIKSPEHVFSAPSTILEDQKCSVHKKILEYYCNEDQACICVYCLAETHRMHRLEPLHEASEKRKEKLKRFLETLDAKRAKVDKDIHNLVTRKDEIPDKATSLTESVTALFSKVRSQLEDLECKVLREISRQQEQASASISNLIQQLEVQKDELSMEIHHIEKLLSATDAVTILQSHVVDFCDVKDRDKTETDQNIHSAGRLDHFLMALILYDGLGHIVTKAKEDFYAIECPEILLDKTTVANNVAITEDLKSVMWSVMSQRRKETPRRFQQYQAFSIQGISSGRHYWEVEASEAEYWMVGMAYPSTETQGDQSWIGNNNKSWCFCRWHDEYSVRHAGRDVLLFPSVSSDRYGVYVDYDAGRLSFYELCDPIRHLHTFHGNFSEPLHAAFWVNDNGWVKIRKPCEA